MVLSSTREGTGPDARNTVWNVDWGQNGALLKGTGPDACHAIADGDGGQADAIMVFESYCVSVSFD